LHNSAEKKWHDVLGNWAWCTHFTHLTKDEIKRNKALRLGSTWENVAAVAKEKARPAEKK
jgi:hypothetical protein